MSDFKELLEQKKAEAIEVFDKDLKAYCEENGISYIPRPENDRVTDFGRIRLEEKYKEHLESKKREEQKKTREQEEEMWRIERLKSFQNYIPPRFKDAAVSNLNMGKQAQKIVDGASALILGSNGPGKTYFIWAVAREWVSRNESYKVVKAQKLLSDIKIQKDPYAYIENNFGKMLEHLAIDEIDKIFESKADYVYLNYLIDMRYEWMVQTIAVGNGDKNNFLEALGQSVFSRLVGDGGVFIQYNGQDRRLLKKEEPTT